jgi:hypothetical protein
MLLGDKMKSPSAFSLELLALPSLISAGLLVPRDTDAIPDITFNKTKFLERYVAAAYCSENFQGVYGLPLWCKASNCCDVEKDDTQIIRSFFN